MTNSKFHDLFGGPPRKPEGELTQHEMDLAASIQKVIEEVVVKLARAIAVETGQKNLCLAGGVALNCVANGVLSKENIFENIWIQPAAGDAGGALGAALCVYYKMLKKTRTVNIGEDSMRGSYLGPDFNDDEVERRLLNMGAQYTRCTPEKTVYLTAKALADGKAIGWMNGRMEFGPRSLGARSIIADPRSPAMQKQLNLKVKYRESFRPFAPSILSEDASDWFDIASDSPYMLLVSGIAESKRISVTEDENSLFGIAKLNVPRSLIPAVTHVDYSARIQTVHKQTNPLFHAVISSFKDITGCPVVVNTSFNVRGEPIVCSPEDAFKCFMGTELDCLVIGNCFLEKTVQNMELKENYENKYDLD
jgi:carbamoyltransferase